MLFGVRILGAEDFLNGFELYLAVTSTFTTEKLIFQPDNDDVIPAEQHFANFLRKAIRFGAAGSAIRFLCSAFRNPSRFDMNQMRTVFSNSDKTMELWEEALDIFSKTAEINGCIGKQEAEQRISNGIDTGTWFAPNEARYIPEKLYKLYGNETAKAVGKDYFSIENITALSDSISEKHKSQYEAEVRKRKKRNRELKELAMPQGMFLQSSFSDYDEYDENLEKLFVFLELLRSADLSKDTQAAVNILNQFIGPVLFKIGKSSQTSGKEYGWKAEWLTDLLRDRLQSLCSGWHPSIYDILKADGREFARDLSGYLLSISVPGVTRAASHRSFNLYIFSPELLSVCGYTCEAGEFIIATRVYASTSLPDEKYDELVASIIEDTNDAVVTEQLLSFWREDMMLSGTQIKVLENKIRDVFVTMKQLSKAYKAYHNAPFSNLIDILSSYSDDSGNKEIPGKYVTSLAVSVMDAFSGSPAIFNRLPDEYAIENMYAPDLFPNDHEKAMLFTEQYKKDKKTVQDAGDFIDMIEISVHKELRRKASAFVADWDLIKDYYNKQDDLAKIEARYFSLKQHVDSLVINDVTKMNARLDALRVSTAEKGASDEDILPLLDQEIVSWQNKASQVLSINSAEDRLERAMISFQRRNINNKEPEDLFLRIQNKDIRKQIKTSIVTADVTYEFLSSSFDKDSMDYSAALIPITRSLEMLLNYIYVVSDDSEWTYRENNDKPLTLKKYAEMVENFNRASSERYRGKPLLNTELLPHIKTVIVTGKSSSNYREKHFNSSEVDNLKLIRDGIYHIADAYRNKGAHKETIKALSYEKCRDLLLRTENLLWILLEILQV